MIYTLTLNPSLDYIMHVDSFKTDHTNRTTAEKILPGGKGINVSIVLRNLGVPSTALGFTAGFTGRELERLLDEKKISSSFIPLDEGMTRINVKLKAEKETEINGQGPRIPSEKIEELYRYLERLEKGDMLVISGSVPNSMPADTYCRIMKFLENKGVLFVVDASGPLLMNVLPYRPFLIKPNHHELGELFGVCVSTKEEAVIYARKLQEKGARSVLVSMSSLGAVLVSETEEVIIGSAPQGTVVNSVGAGDSMVAGFLAGYLQSNDYREAFTLGICAGSATAFTEDLAEAADILALKKQYKSE